MFNYYVETHWCNKDEYIDRDYRVYIPEVVGYDLNTFAEQLSNIQILQNMLIEFRKKMNLMQLTYNYSDFRILKSLYIVFLVSPNTLYSN